MLTPGGIGDGVVEFGKGMDNDIGVGKGEGVGLCIGIACDTVNCAFSASSC